MSVRRESAEPGVRVRAAVNPGRLRIGDQMRQGARAALGAAIEGINLGEVAAASRR